MYRNMIPFMNAMLSGLLAGALAMVWVGFNPQKFTFSTYLEFQQEAIRSLNTLMPILGLATIAVTIASAFQQKDNKSQVVLLIISAILLIMSGLITRFGNQPINATVMTWTDGQLPDNWEKLRDQWMFFHQIRTLFSFIAFCVIAWVQVVEARYLT